MDRYEIQAEIRRRGLTQGHIAKALGVTPMAVSRVISGETKSRRIREAIAEHIGRATEAIWPATGRSQNFSQN